MFFRRKPTIKKSNPRYVFLMAAVLVLFLLPTVYSLLTRVDKAEATWYDENYRFRQKFSFTHNAAISAQRSITFTLDTAELITDGVMQSDCDDTRFTDLNGLLLPYDLTGTCNNASTTYEVIFPSIANGLNVGYVYYGNASTSNAEIDSTVYTALTPSSGDPAAITTRTAEDKSPGPVAYWKFDEAADNTCSGGTNDACDATNGSNDLARTNVTWQTKDLCISGTCMHGDGSGDYLSRADDSDLDFVAADTFSVSGWFRHPEIATNSDFLVAKHQSTTAGGYKVYMDSDGDIAFGIDDDGTWGPEDVVGDDQSRNLDDNLWHHFEAVKNGTTGIYIYVDGTLIDSDNSLTASGSLANAASFYLGIDADGSSNSWDGSFDEIKVYSYARSAAQIKTDFNKGSSAKGSSAVLGAYDQSVLSNGLVGYWKLNESSGNATDVSGLGTTLTNNNTTTYVAGKFANGSEHVPASSQYLSTATTLSGIKTVTFWTNPDSTTNYFVSLTSGAYVTATSGTLAATGFTNPKIFVNGVQTTTIAADVWQQITVSSDTAISANQVYIGRQGSNYYDGTLDDVRFYNRALSPSEAEQLYRWSPGPVGYYKFDENTGQEVFDSSGNNSPVGTLGVNNGSASDDPAWDIGKFGSGLDFDGTADQVRLSNTNLDITNQVSVMAWIKHDATQTGDFRIVNKETTNGGYGIYVHNDNVAGKIGDGSNCFENTSTAVPLNEWHHVAMTHDGVTKRLYLDGIEVFNEACGLLQTSSTTYTAVGSTAGASQFFDGKIDDVRIYNYARTQGQLVEDMNGGHPLGGSPVGSQLAYWKFDTGGGQNFYDSVANYDGILGATSASGEATDPTWKTESNCKFGMCLDFDNGDYLLLTGSPQFDIVDGEDRTITGWFKRDVNGNDDVILANKNNRTSTTSGFTVYLSTTDKLVFQIGDGTDGYELTSTTTFSTATWYHFAVVFDDNDAANTTIYINGQEDSPTKSGTIANIGAANTGDDLVIGAESDLSNLWDGSLDDLKIYGAALTQEQVRIDMNANASINFGTGQVEAALLTDGAGTAPVGYWTFDENTSTTVKDLSGNAANASFTGSPSWGPGKIGSAISSPGGSNIGASYVDGGSIPLDIAGSFTVSAWVRSDTTITAQDDYARVVNKGGDTYNYSIAASNGDNIQCSYHDGSNYHDLLSTGISFTTGQWYHITCVLDDTANTFKIYVNGILNNSDTPTQSPSANNNPMTFLYNASDGSDNFIGAVDEVKVYNYVRTQSQVAYDYNRGKPIAHWKMDECTGTSIYDSSGNGYTGTLTIGGSGTYTSAGTCSSGTSTEAWNAGTTGKLNSSLAFDGTNDYIDLNYKPNFYGSYSVASWFKSVDASQSNQTILGAVEDGDGDPQWVLQLATTDASSGIQIYTNQSTGSTISIAINTKDYRDSQWHHAVAVHDKSSLTMSLYVDGKLIGTSAFGSGTEYVVSSTDWSAGARNNNGSISHYFDGQLDDMRIYNYALSASQIKQVMNDGAASRFGPETGSP